MPSYPPLVPRHYPPLRSQCPQLPNKRPPLSIECPILLTACLSALFAAVFSACFSAGFSAPFAARFPFNAPKSPPNNTATLSPCLSSHTNQQMMLLIPVILLSTIGTSLLLPHGCKHAADDPATSTAQRESCAVVCYFQPKDIAHFETWIVICVTNGTSLAASGRSSPTASIVLLSVAAFLTLMLIVSHVVFWAATETNCDRREHLLPTICEEGKSNEGTVNRSNEKLTQETNCLHTLLHNVSNHETWILVCFTNAVSLAVV